jgi:hypothetical protein
MASRIQSIGSWLTVLMVLLFAGSAAAQDVSPHCEAAMDRAAGDYSRCLLRADASYARHENAAKLENRHTRCQTRFDRRTSRAIKRYGADECVSAVLVSQMADLSVSCADGVAQGAAGGSEPLTIIGIFFDSHVEGLGYTTSISMRHAQTNSEGEFTCQEDEDITFSIGSLVIGTSRCQTLVTPSSLFDDAVQASNLGVLIMALDENGNPDDGIKIPLSIQTQTTKHGSFAEFSDDILEVQTSVNRIIAAAPENTFHGGGVQIADMVRLAVPERAGTEWVTVNSVDGLTLHVTDRFMVESDVPISDVQEVRLWDADGDVLMEVMPLLANLHLRLGSSTEALRTHFDASLTPLGSYTGTIGTLNISEAEGHCNYTRSIVATVTPKSVIIKGFGAFTASEQTFSLPRVLDSSNGTDSFDGIINLERLSSIESINRENARVYDQIRFSRSVIDEDLAASYQAGTVNNNGSFFALCSGEFTLTKNDAISNFTKMRKSALRVSSLVKNLMAYVSAADLATNIYVISSKLMGLQVRLYNCIISENYDVDVKLNCLDEKKEMFEDCAWENPGAACEAAAMITKAKELNPLISDELVTLATDLVLEMEAMDSYFSY